MHKLSFAALTVMGLTTVALADDPKMAPKTDAKTDATLIGAHQPVVTGVVGMLPPVLGAFWLARAASDVVVRRALPTWRAELARAHGVSEAALEEHARVAGGSAPSPPVELEP